MEQTINGQTLGERNINRAVLAGWSWYKAGYTSADTEREGERYEECVADAKEYLRDHNLIIEGEEVNQNLYVAIKERVESPDSPAQPMNYTAPTYIDFDLCGEIDEEGESIDATYTLVIEDGKVSAYACGLIRRETGGDSDIQDPLNHEVLSPRIENFETKLMEYLEPITKWPSVKKVDA